MSYLKCIESVYICSTQLEHKSNSNMALDYIISFFLERKQCRLKKEIENKL